MPTSSQSKDKKCKHLRRAEKLVVMPIRPLSKQQQDSTRTHDKQTKKGGVVGVSVKLKKLFSKLCILMYFKLTIKQKCVHPKYQPNNVKIQVK